MSTPLSTETEWSAAATARTKDRLEGQWQAIIGAERTYGTWRIRLRGKTYEGDWVIRLGGWAYFLKHGAVYCSAQGAEYLHCGEVASATAAWSGPNAAELRDDGKLVGQLAIRAAVKQPAMTVAMLRAFERAMFGSPLATTIDSRGVGHAIIETIVNEPEAAVRKSRRYRVSATLTADGFALGEPVFVEQYEERCWATNGCYETHWSCSRLTDRSRAASKQ